MFILSFKLRRQSQAGQAGKGVWNLLRWYAAPSKSSGEIRIDPKKWHDANDELGGGCISGADLRIRCEVFAIKSCGCTQIPRPSPYGQHGILHGRTVGGWPRMPGTISRAGKGPSATAPDARHSGAGTTVLLPYPPCAEPSFRNGVDGANSRPVHQTTIPAK